MNAEQELSFTCAGNKKMVQLPCKTISLPTPILFPNELKLSVHIKPYTEVFIAALFVIAKN